jgi:hypothetical protein
MLAAVSAPHLPRCYDVCNGDADGLCAVLQWRLHQPAATNLVTGLKREIALLDRVPAAAADEVLVCDLSLERNRAALMGLLAAGIPVRWFDHHALATPVPPDSRLEAHIDTSNQVCSSLLVDRALGGRYRGWALVGAYGDNLTGVADALALDSGFDAGQRAALRRLGEAINYNAYGDDEGDVCIAPARLYAILAGYRDPLSMLAHEPIADTLDQLRRADLACAESVTPRHSDARACALVLPDAPWSRRVIGCLANQRARLQPEQAQAVLKAMPAGDYVVSLRAPLVAPRGAHELAAQFGGGGRAGAAGIDHLQARDLPRFIEAFAGHPWGSAH